jgi:[acyl-carrier-protein] S-malonyltransferase
LEDRISLLFPAIGIEFFGNERELVRKFTNELNDYFIRAKDVLNLNFQINFSDEHYLKNELESQFLTYLYSCVISNIIKNNNIKIEYAAGYSMGLYSALYFAGAVTFEEGLLLIRSAFDNSINVLKNIDFAMAGIIGLEEKFLIDLINKNFSSIEIINRNNPHSLVVSGLKNEINELLLTARDEGALNTKILPVSAPYHTKFVKEAGVLFYNFIKSIKIKSASSKLVSGIDQRIFTTKDEIENELLNNLLIRMNWNNTMNKLIELKSNIMIECGPGNSLYKNGKFIEGDFKIYTLKTLSRLIDNT